MLTAAVMVPSAAYFWAKLRPMGAPLAYPVIFNIACCIPIIRPTAVKSFYIPTQYPYLAP
jgi:hypothetical protein